MKKLPIFTAMAGLAACALHLAALRFALDRKALLVPGHPLCVLLWVLTAAAALKTLLSVFRLDGSPRYADNFSPSLPAAAGTVALALGIGVTVFFGRFASGRLDVIRNVTGILSIPALAWTAICRREGRQPHFLLCCPACLFLILHTVSRYQLWCSQSQLLNYFFPMLGCVLLTLFSYQQTAFSAGMGKRRSQLLCGLWGAFFCFGAAALGRDAALYVTGGIWMITNLCSLTPVPRRRKNPLTEPQENPHASA